MMKNVLVTGGGGFLGTFLVEALLVRGDNVTVLSRGDYPKLKEMGVTLIQADLTDKNKVMDACENKDTVFHLAAKTGPWGDYNEFYRTNVEGTENIVDACVKKNVKRLVYTSSPSVLSPFEDLSGVDESYPYPDYMVSAYQKTKMLAEKHVLASNEKNGLITCSLRPHAIWGPRDTQLFAAILVRIKQGKMVIVGEGTNKISVSYVENAAYAHIQASESENVGGKVYFVNEPEPVDMWPWINSLCQQLDIAPITKTISYKLAFNLGFLSEKLYGWLPFLGEPKFTRGIAATCGRDHYFDISAAVKDFGLSSPVSMEEATRRFVDYYKNNPSEC